MEEKETKQLKYEVVGEKTIVGEIRQKPNNPNKEILSEAQKARIRLKELFLENYEKTLCMVKLSCAKTGIHHDTYYEWMKSDATFVKKAGEIIDNLANTMEERLRGHILSGDKPSLRFWMSKKCPGFNTTKIETEFKPIKSWKETVEEYQDEQTKILNAHNNKQTIQTDESGSDRNQPQNKE